MTPPGAVAYVSALAAVLGDPVGVYLHGSAVLGGFRPAAGDIDVLAVVGGPLPGPEQDAIGRRLAAVPGCPGIGLEMSVVTAATAADLGDCRFEVHVNTAGPEPVVLPGADRPGDPDLVLHVAVCRQRSLAVTGPPAAEVFGPVERSRVLAAMAGELAWALRAAPARYAVLNACRALRFAADGRLVSKVDGGRWYLARHGPDPVVGAALAAQTGDGPPPDAAGTERFVGAALRRLPRA